MSTAHKREKARDEARETRHAFRDDFMGWGNESDAYDDGFVAGRTVTAEQIEQVAVRLFLMNDDSAPWAVTDESVKRAYRSVASDLFAAAGLIVEEES